MSGSRRLIELYFDLFYNRVYDITSAGISSYRRSQDNCICRLEFADNDRVLCVGVGTGNEVRRILDKNSNIYVVGVDVSSAALRRVSNKVAKPGKTIELYRMDAQNLGFFDNAFDKALCLHVMGFLANDRQATAEILRVLKKGAGFVITYPAGNGVRKLGAEVGQSLKHKLSSGKCREAVKELAAAIGAWIVNVPISHWVKPRQGFYSRQQLEAMLSCFKLSCCQIEEDRIYEEFIVFGTKGE